MAMNKSEMEYHRASYNALVSKANLAQQHGRYAEALDVAISSWAHVDGMIQYERRFGVGEVGRIEGLELVLEFAPLLFDFESLDKLEAFIKSNRRIDRNNSTDWHGRLARARSLMRDARILWNRLECAGCAYAEAVAFSGLDSDDLHSIAQLWHNIGVLRRESNKGATLELMTDIEASTSAKCPSCGVVAKASKVKFLGEQSCPKCRKTVSFVLLLSEQFAGN